MRVFERLLGPSSLECLEALLDCSHAVFPISSGGVRLISLEVITLAIYLGSWALIALVIAFKFLLDFRLFLLEAIGASSLGPLLFQMHLRLL